MLRSKPGILHAEVLGARDGDAYTFKIECEVGVDIRKSLFYTLAEKNWPLIGIEALGMSLEDVFVALVDQIAEQSNRYERKTRIAQKSETPRARNERELAKKITEKTVEEKGERSALFDDEDED